MAMNRRMDPNHAGCSDAKTPSALVQSGSSGNPGMCIPRPHPPCFSMCFCVEVLCVFLGMKILMLCRCEELVVESNVRMKDYCELNIIHVSLWICNQYQLV